MPIIPLICPNCGANLQVNSDDPILTCQYCNSSSVMKDAIVHNYIQNTVNITAGTVNVVNQKDFVIEGGVLKKYQGESVDVVIPNNVVSIYGAFKDLKIKSVVIPDSVTEIDWCAFSGCTSLTSVTIPNSVTKIGSGAFSACTSLTSVTIPDSVTEIGNSAFEKCTALKSVTIPNSVKKIGALAFKGCTAFTSIIIPHNVTLIDQSAFADCIALKSVTISNSSTEVRSWAFYDCTALSSINAANSILYEDNRVSGIFTNTAFAKAFYEKRQYISNGRCQHCGGEFKGAFKKVCSRCGKPKDY